LAADCVNASGAEIVCVQHEFGIFGGDAGSHVLALLRAVRVPVVTTLHTVLSEPNQQQRQAMDELIHLSERVVVMSRRGADLLREVHGVRGDKIDEIPHGIPEVPLGSSSKHRLGIESKSVMMTFGLLSPDKGVEHVIDALPEVLAAAPETVYLVLGATHPHIKERDGETYRCMLEKRAAGLGVASHVIFHNRFVSQTELVEFLSAADVYITPYLKPAQITSGTLAYAVGSGRAVISTPYWHALELLADGRGILVPWSDPRAIAREVVGLLSDEPKRRALCQRAAAHGRDMKWPVVAHRYMQSFERARADRANRRRNGFDRRHHWTQTRNLPEVNLEHLRRMTDDTGILQHATFSVPRYEEGYCLDDNARALLLVTRVEEAEAGDPRLVRDLASRYLAFVSYAFEKEHRRFRNFLSYSRRWCEECGSEDCHGRALWALGTMLGRTRDEGGQGLGEYLFHEALPAVSTFTSPRAWAFALLGIDEYLRLLPNESRVQSARRELSGKLLECFRRSKRQDWPWFEDGLTYCNARLPHALLASGARMANDEMVAAGLASLEWLASIQRSREGHFAPIGSNGFYRRLETKARFDQQPVDAGAMVSACLEANRVTGDGVWSSCAFRAFDWFLGRNELHANLYDAATGGCRDALHADRANQNQGAESTLSFLLALVEMRSARTADRVEGTTMRMSEAVE
jgi:glycosyltransferase involved in cell wall biosynthesis